MKSAQERNPNELPTVDIKSSNWKGTLISILVILLLCSVITFAIYVINPDIQNKFTRNLDKEKLKFSEWLAGKYNPSSTYNGTWISDTELVFIDKQGSFVNFDVSTKQNKTLVDATIMKEHEVSRAVLSPDQNYVLLISDIKGVFRHSTLAHYKIFNISTSDVITVKPEDANDNAYLQVAQWAPIGSQLVFVYMNNIYYMPTASKNDSIKITTSNTDGAERYIYNGIPDWIYEEEILAVATALWWSPDGSKIAFAQFNDTNVEFQEYPWYGDTVDKSSQYLDRVKIKYPKPGHTNPTVKLFVVTLTNSVENVQLESVSPPANLEADHYLTSVAWVNTKCFIAVWFNRDQNNTSYSRCDPSTNVNEWECKNNHEEKINGGWAEVKSVYASPDGENYFTLLADKSAYKHVQIVRINIQVQSEGPIYLTTGRRDVTSIMRIVERADTGKIVIYYMATREDHPGERHAYSVEVPSRKMPLGHYEAHLKGHRVPPAKATDQCYTCDQIELKKCLYNRVSFSRKASFYVHECLGPEIPFSTLRRSEIDSNFTEPWLNNDALADTLSKKLLPEVRTELINFTDYSLIVQMFMPPSYKEGEIVKYPLLMQVYGGPGSQNVNENFKMNFGKYLASAKNIIYAYVDGRGSGYQGEAMKYHLYHKLGTAEIEDQIKAAKYLRDNYKFIDKDAIGIWGWSYGGYATAMVLAKDTVDPVFACGISVAPVTSWLLYDSAYTERFMGLPENNQQSYFMSDIMHLANNFKGKKFLLIHGTADDNVHVQNSMALIKALNAANVMFQTQMYPDENHGLPGVSMHLYNRIEKFLEECLHLDTYIEEIGLRRRRIVKHGPV